MLPPRQQPRSGLLHTSLSLVSADASNSDQIRDSPTESASSRETYPAAHALMLSKQLEREKANASAAEHSVIRHISSSDKMSLRDISKDRVDVIAERMHHLPVDFLDKLKNELRGLIEGMGGHQHKEEYIFLQKMVLSRGDLTEKTLIMAHRGQLEILVAIKTGIQAFLHPTLSLSQASLIEIFLYRRCRNIACGNQIPADNCTCEICSKRNGFCNLCMCVICSKFDFEVNTCRWIGCDSCSHWTHTDCAIHNAQIGMGPTINGGSSGGMLFRCRACLRTSELFGWVKDVFHHCAPLWVREALVRELEYVSRIFRGSEEPRGRKLYWKCGELVEKLKSGVAEPLASKAILSFFQAVKFEELVEPAPDTKQKLALLYQIPDKERACFSGVAPSELSCSAENTPSMSSAPKSSTKFSLSDLKLNMVKKEKSEVSPVVKSVHTPTTRAAKRKKSADSIINLESFNDLSAEETKDRLLLGVNHLVQLLKKREDELLEAREECLRLKKIVVEKEGLYKQQEVALKKEIVEMTGKVEEERKVMAEEAQSSAANSVIEAMYEMAQEAAAAGFSLPTWDVKAWAEMLGKPVDQARTEAGEDAGKVEGVGEGVEQDAGGSGDGLLMGDEDGLNV